jgi:hypothetical protein
MLSAAPALAQPPAPVVIGPRGLVEGTTHVFSWRARSGATWYELWVADALTSPKVDEWFTAGQVDCPEGTGVCSARLSIGLAVGQATWWVRAYNSGGSGPWTAANPFVVRQAASSWDIKLASGSRFQLVHGNQAVLDRETGLVWERAPSTTTYNWQNGRTYCYSRLAAGRQGWRTPTVDELATLYDPSSGLPSGHPFVVSTDPNTWSATPTTTAGLAFSLNFHAGIGVVVGNTLNSGYVWCVRGNAGQTPP